MKSTIVAVAVLVLLGFGSRPAAAHCSASSGEGQDTAGAAPDPAPCETPEEVNGRVRYERALRAWLEGRFDAARAEGQAGLEASPGGRFAAATRELLGRFENDRRPSVAPTALAPAAAPPRPANARGELISFATFTGGLLGGLTAGAVKADGRGYAGLIMLGTAAGLVGSIVATSDGPVRPAYPQMLETGVAYGAFSVLLVDAIANSRIDNPAGAVAAGVLLGGAGGLGAAYAAKMTGGDAASTFAGLLYGAGVPVLFELALTDDYTSRHDNLYAWTALIGGTVGLVGGPLLNRQLNWTIGRWRLVELGGIVGLVFGTGTAVLVDVKSDKAGFALAAGGTVIGLGLAALATSGFDADEPREHRQALLDVAPDGKVRLGSVTEALRPALIAGRGGRTEVGAALNVLGGHF